MKSSLTDGHHWGIVAGLLMFSFVALCGIAFRVDPFVVAQRATCSSVITGFVAHVTARVVAVTLNGRR